MAKPIKMIEINYSGRTHKSGLHMEKIKITLSGILEEELEDAL